MLIVRKDSSSPTTISPSLSISLIHIYTVSSKPSPQSLPPCLRYHIASAPSRPRLREFLIRDISPEGHRLLPPFLTTTDLLHLSECSQGLLDYRYHLSRVNITSPRWSTPAMDEGLTRLLSGQRLGIYITTLEPKVLKIIRSGAMGPHLKGLEIISLRHQQEQGKQLCLAMEEKACIHLEELELEFNFRGVGSAVNFGGPIMSLLAQGTPVMRHVT